jgi:hypothetical protein
MANNLSISVRADTAEARAQLALVQSDIKSLGSALRQAANDARSAGIGDAITPQLQSLAAQFEEARAKSAELGKTLSGEVESAFGRLNAAIREVSEPLAMMSSGLRETAEIAGVMFAVDKMREYINSMGELGERTVNMAAAVGTTPHEFSLLSNALALAGGDAETASTTLERLGRNMEEALTSKTSQAAKAVASLGITQTELKRASTDLSYALDLIADKFAAFADSPQKTADFIALLGRGFERLVPLLRLGSAGMEEFKAKAQETGLVLSDEEAHALEETGEKVHLLGATLEGEGVHGFLAIRGAIDSAIDGLTSLVKWAGDAVKAIGNVDAAAAQAENFRLVREGKTGGETSASSPGDYLDPRTHRWRARPAGGLPGGDVEMNVGGMTIPAAPAPDQDFSGGGKPQVAPWAASGGRGRSGGGGKGGENQAYQDFAEGERLKIEEARASGQSLDAIYAEWLARAAATYGQDSVQFKRIQLEKANAARQATQQMFSQAEEDYSAKRQIDDASLTAFKANMSAMVAEHKISKTQMYGFEIEYTAQLYAEERKRLEVMMGNDQLSKADKLRLYEQLEELDANYTAKVSEDQAKAAAATSTSWQQSVKQVSDNFATMTADVVTGTKTIGAAFDDLIKSMIKDVASSAFKSLFESVLGVGGGGGGSGGGGGGLGSGIFDSIGKSLFGEGLSGAIGNPFSSASGGLLGGLFGNLFGGGGGDQDFSGGVGIGAGGIFGSLFSGIGSLFGFEKGGIVPSAAGGWAVPQLGSGGTLAQLHSNEMVLPANLSQGIQGMINKGGGGNNSFGISINAMDASSVSKLFMSNGSQLVAALNSALRRGSTLAPG